MPARVASSKGREPSDLSLWRQEEEADRPAGAGRRHCMAGASRWRTQLLGNLLLTGEGAGEEHLPLYPSNLPSSNRLCPLAL